MGSMFGHLRGNLLLLVFTVVICCGLYPLALWGIGQAFFPEQAAGSLIVNKDNAPIGSKLIGQSFTGPGYFQPRPSSAGNGYNASASGGSNWSASNPKLRNQAARILGTNARFATGEEVGPAIEQWFADRTNPEKMISPGETDAVTLWARAYPTLAIAWVKADPANSDYVANWKAADLDAMWRADTQAAPDATPKSEDLAPYFFPSFAKTHPGKWPVARDEKAPDGKTVRAITLVTADDDVRATFFETWFQETKPDIKPVPADMVLGSGSGLDPHITRRNAEYQAARVVEERAKPHAPSAKAAIAKRVDELIAQHAFTPMAGLAAGDELVNVLELNLALDEAMKGF